MSLFLRVEKLKFLTEEMQLAFHLARHAPTEDEARILTRHVLVRAENLISHARALKKPLNAAGYKTKRFHQTKEIYAEFFDEYFKIARDRLGAHVQDFDFGKRIDLWNDIETVKVEFFVEGAQEIYASVEALGISGVKPYREPSEVGSQELRAKLTDWKKSASHGPWTEMGADPLAMARPNTVSMLNGTTVHARAGQLSLIRRWVKSQRDLVTRLDGYDNLIRIIKARLVTDVVSFCDCLITRPVPLAAPQYMEGLDRLLLQNGQTADVIDSFVAVYAFETTLKKLRSVRDKIGAHVEIDGSVSAANLISVLDTLDLPQMLSFYDDVRAIYEKVCRRVVFLRMYVVEDQRLFGFTAQGHAVTPFDGRNASQAGVLRPPPPRPNDTDEYQKSLLDWGSSDSDKREIARQHLRDAIVNSETVGTIDCAEGIGFSSLNFRTVHQFLLNELVGASDAKTLSIIDLLIKCASSDPDSLTEILMRFVEAGASPRHYAAISFALGALATWSNEKVRAYLSQCVAATIAPILQAQALIALFKIFVRSEGSKRFNERRQSANYADAIEPFLANMIGTDRLLCLVMLASQFCSPHLFGLEKAFSDELTVLHDEIKTLSLPIFIASDLEEPARLLNGLLNARDFVGVCMLLGDHLTAAGRTNEACRFWKAPCNGLVITASHDYGFRHLAGCFQRVEELSSALEIVQGLSTRNPDNVDYQVLAAQILSLIPASKAAASEAVTRIRLCYTLTAIQDAELAAVENKLRKAASDVEN